MNEIEDTSDGERQSRRGRFKDAFSRTKSKWKKDKASPEVADDNAWSEDVNDFLAGGRRAAAIAAPTRMTTATIPTTAPPSTADDSRLYISSPRPSTSDSMRSGQRSPRGMPVPRLDISQSPRFPHSRDLSTDPRMRIDEHLSPDYSARQGHTRSHSLNSALAKNRSKPRGLHVTFINSAPVIIGEGGDKAELPPIEISRSRQRSRSLSPYLDRPTSQQSSNASTSRSPIKRKPVPPPTTTTSNEPDHDHFQPKSFRRTQTGFSDQGTPARYNDADFAQELNKALRLGGDNESSDDPFANTHTGNVNPMEKHDSRNPNASAPVRETRPVEQRNDRYPMANPTYQFVAPPTMARNAERLDKIQPVNMQHHSPEPVHMRNPPPRSPPHPDLQQSAETSQRRSPPKVPNFYGEVNRRSLEGGKQLTVHQVQEVYARPHLEASPDSPAPRRQPPINIPQPVTRQGQAVVQPPYNPGGWI